MAGELENKKFINDRVKPFMNQTLPYILARLDDLEGSIIMEPWLDVAPEDVGLEAWKQKTYGK